jgi:hypothetical protein
MLKWKSLVPMALTVGLVSLVAVHAQPKATEKSLLESIGRGLQEIGL